MYLCLISTHELLLPAAIIFSQMKRHLGGYLRKKGVNIKFIPIFVLIRETLLNTHIPVSEVSGGGGGTMKLILSQEG